MGGGELEAAAAAARAEALGCDLRLPGEPVGPKAMAARVTEPNGGGVRDTSPLPGVATEPRSPRPAR